jgi:hypothetical protein
MFWNRVAGERPNRSFSGFLVFRPGPILNEARTSEDLNGVGEIDSVLRDICLSLLVVPLEFHSLLLQQRPI